MQRTRRAQNSINKRTGNQIEEMAIEWLVHQGFAMIEPIYDAWRPVQSMGGNRRLCVPSAKLQGDIKAIWPATGQAVLMECKWRTEKLLYSDLATHQRAALDGTLSAKGIPLVLWAWPGGFSCMRWPIAVLVPRTSLSKETAQALHHEPRKGE